MFIGLLSQTIFGQKSDKVKMSSPQSSPWEFGSKFGLHFINNFSLEYGYGVLNTEGYSSFEIGSEFQLRQQLLIAPKVTYTLYPHFWDMLDMCFGIDAIAFNDFNKIEPIIRPKIGVHVSALLELSYGYNWAPLKQTNFNISQHEISLVFRMLMWKAIE